MDNKRVKIIGLIIGIAMFIGLLASITYAYYEAKAEASLSGEAGACFNINSTNGGNITDADLLLFDENNIINNGNITVKNGMAVTSISAGIDSSCSNTHAYLTIKIEETTMNSNFVSGDSVGALKYIIASYSKSQYPTVNITNLNNHDFTILKTGSITSTDDEILYVDILPNGTMKDYLIIFYVDGELAHNGIGTGTTNFSSTIKAIATQSNDATNNAAGFIRAQYEAYDKVTTSVNSISYSLAPGSGLMDDNFGNIRYYGTGITDTGGTYKEPDNYIDIGDNVLWRIIGVFDGKLKLIRSTYITADNDSGLSWDTSANTSTTNSGNGINEWSQADLMKLLNPGYDSNQDLNSSGATITVNNSLWYNSQSGTCYNGQSNAITSCNFTSTGLSDSVKDKIADVTWNLGGWNSNSIYTNVMYDKERGTTVYTGTADGITRTTSWTGKIGLAYPSDYGYATDLQECNQTLYNYNNAGTNNTYPCRGNNWMWYAMSGATTVSPYLTKTAWLLTPHSASVNGAWHVNEYGRVERNGGVYGAYAVSPVLYLKADQIIMSGCGTSNDPYLIGEDTSNRKITNILNTTWKLPTQGLVGTVVNVASEKYPGVVSQANSIIDFPSLSSTASSVYTNLIFNVNIKYQNNEIAVRPFYANYNFTLTNGYKAYTTGGEIIDSGGVLLAGSPYVIALLITGSTWNSITWDGTITFTGGPDINNELLIQWLNDNATFMG